MPTPQPTRHRRLSFREALRQQKWLTLIGLPVLLMSTLAGIYAIWGLLFIFWGVTSLRSGEVYLLEPITRREDPVLFWIISILWIGSGAAYVLADLFPQLVY